MRLWTVMDWANSCISHYNHDKYWKRKAVLADKNTGILQKLCCLLYLKRCESYNNASLGNRLDGGSVFVTPPFLPHGIKGIFVSDYAVIGENATIYQQVTIGVKNPGGVHRLLEIMYLLVQGLKSSERFVLGIM